MEKIKLENLFGINEIFGDYGIFCYLAQVDIDNNPLYLIVADFINQSNYLLLDEDYFIGNSAEKYLSPIMIKFIKSFMDANNIPFEKLIFNQLDDTDKQSIITALFSGAFIPDIIYNRFGAKWKSIYDAFTTSYKPLENYAMEEIRTPDITRTEDSTITSDTNAETSIDGFNSVESNASNDTIGEQKDIVDRDYTETGTETTTRNGNIGVTTSQQMLESEIKIRQYDFYKQIYKDVDSLLCLKIY